jgi:hypothetical protein
MRDYVEWHRAYDDPESSLSWRLRTVQDYLRDELDARPGPLRVVSVCAGDGRDVIGVLAERADAGRVRAVLIELHPALTEQARVAADDLPGVEVRETDAGTTAAYAGAVPADVLLLVGVLGNISDDDIERTVRAVPSLCASGALVVWSRGATDDVRNDRIRGWLAEIGCTELGYGQSSTGGAGIGGGVVSRVTDPQGLPADAAPAGLGAARFTGTPVALPADERLFPFLR